MPPKSLWSEYKNSEGRTYWSNSETKQSVWEKPDDLRTPFERALAQTDWKQYTSKDRPYYVNSVTKETKWDLPQELLELKRRLEQSSPMDGNGSPAGSTPNLALAPYHPSSTPAAPVAPSAPKREPPPKWPIGGFLTHDKAEEAFMKLLKYENIDEHSTWEDTMRKIITHELYKALDTLSAKKTAFVKYQRNIVNERRAAKESRIAKARPALRSLFEKSEYIKSWSTVKTADQVFKDERAWKTAFPDERESILNEYTKEMREREEKEERELRERNISALSELIRQLDITIATRWRQAHDVVVSSTQFKADGELQKIDTIDMMSVYDDYMRVLEGEQEEESRKYRETQIRDARRARDGFRSLLDELKEKGELGMYSKWKDLYPTIKKDERYLTLLGHPGSSPLDLWMDAVDDAAEETYRAADKIIKAIEPNTIGIDTTYDEYSGWIKDHHLDNQVEDKLIKAVYDEKIRQAKQDKADEERRAERKKRHRIDDLRYALKSVQRHIDLEMSFEEAKPFMKELKEWKEVEEEQDRRTAFEKFIKRQKEKLEERERYDRDRRHSRHSPEDERERDVKRARTSASASATLNPTANGTNGANGAKESKESKESHGANGSKDVEEGEVMA